MRYAICYVSTAVKKLDREEIKELLEYTEEKNNRINVKGLLLYSEGNFFHVMEGEKKIVHDLYEQIQNDPRHHNIIQVLGKELDHGAFDGFKSDIVTDENKYDPDILQEYLEPVRGMDKQTQLVVKDILEVFIETRK